MSDNKEIIGQMKKWIEQEQVWDEQIYATSGASKPPMPSSRQVVSRDPVAAGVTSKINRKDPKKEAALQALYEKYKGCTRCALGFTRIKFVFGVGSPDSEVLFIGEGPGYEEDRRGEPFVGKAGQLLDKMMAAIGLSRQSNAYIANIVKCHPMANPLTPEARGNDRPPSPEESEVCSPILLQQILIIQPKVIMTLGSPSTKMILKTRDAITGLRGKLYPFPVDLHYPPISLDPALQLTSEVRQALGQVQVLPTFHPAALLRNPNLKPESWSNLKLLRATLARKV